MKSASIARRAAAAICAGALLVGGATACSQETKEKASSAASEAADAAKSAATDATSAAKEAGAEASSEASKAASAASSAVDDDTKYTMAEVEKHNKKDDCWAVVEHDVYNLTDWIDSHPGGSDKIEALCGTDATQKFENKHGKDEKPEERLDSFKIGELDHN